MKKTFLILIIILSSLILHGTPVEIVPGVTLERMISYKGEKQIINIARIDLKRQDIHIGVGLGDSSKEVGGKPYGKEAVSTIVEKHKALLGVNADFFIMNSFRDSLNFSMIKGEIVSEPQYNREVMLIDEENNIFFDIPTLKIQAISDCGTIIDITGINRNRSTGDAILFTDMYAKSTLSKYKSYDIVLRPVFGDRLRPNTQFSVIAEKIIPDAIDTPIEPGTFILSTTLSCNPDIKNIKEGDLITIDVRLCPEKYRNIKYATGGGPRLIENGCVHITEKEGSFKSDITKGRAPRTAVGITEDQSLMILATVDGRSENSKGMSLTALAEFMKETGAYNAINFDGGGSTTMSILGLVMNSPSEISERYVANALLVWSDYQGSEYTPKTDYSNVVFRTDSTYFLSDLGKSVWGTKGGVGYFSESGFHTYTKDRKGRIGYIRDGIKYEFDTEISSDTMGNIVIDFADSEKTEKGILYHCSAKMFDTKDKPMALCPVFLYPENGLCEKTRIISDEKGCFSFDVLFYYNETDTEKTEEEIQTEREKSVSKLKFVFGSFQKEIYF